MALIEFDRISKLYPGTTAPAVDELSLAIEAGEFLTLLGPSGSGKTTTLMLLAGFEQPSAGEIRLDGQPIQRLPPHRRGMGVVFQSYSLFPHLTVAQNVAFPLSVRKVAAAETAARVAAALDTVRLPHLAGRKPQQLSGGQQQRVALARALVFEPRVVLMDEPLSALDKKLREEMQLEIRRLHRELGVTMVFVTHDQSEAMTLSDRVAVFNQGRIEQLATPQALYDSPANAFVAGFVGDNNTLPGHVDGDGHLRLPDGRGLHARGIGTLGAGAAAQLCVRPERLHLSDGGAGHANRLPATVLDAIHQGDHWRVVARLQGLEATWFAKLAPRELPRPPAPGDSVHFSFGHDDAWLFPA
ncbi:MAG: ABC transporter ATP-binding protein [Rubrivivax sp.]|nr:ABC transporter ATP-binding protein [Rubrivivax sp.]